MKLKIVSDGTSWGTKVVNADTGESVDGVASIDWSISANAHEVATIFEVVRVAVEITGEAAIETIPLESFGE